MFLVYKNYKEFQRAVKDSPFRSGVTDLVTCSWKLTLPQSGLSDVKIFTALVVDKERCEACVQFPRVVSWLYTGTTCESVPKKADRHKRIASLL